MALTHLSHDGRDYQKLVRETLLELRAWHRSPHPLATRFVVCPRDERKQDIDNRLKPIIDALKNGFLFVDDSQIECIEVRRGPVVRGGAIFVTVEECLPDRDGSLQWIGVGAST